MSASNGSEALETARKKRENADKGLPFSTSLPVHIDRYLLPRSSNNDKRTLSDKKRGYEPTYAGNDASVNKQSPNVSLPCKSPWLNDLALQHELTLDSLEKEMRVEMENDLSTLERDSLAREESRMRDELELRLNRQLESLQDKLDVEQDRRLEEHKAQLKVSNRNTTPGRASPTT